MASIPCLWMSDKCLIGEVNATSPQLFTVCSSLVNYCWAEALWCRCWPVHLTADNFTVLITDFKGVIREEAIFPIMAHWRKLTQEHMAIKASGKISQEFHHRTVGRLPQFKGGNKHFLCMCTTAADVYWGWPDGRVGKASQVWGPEFWSQKPT